MKQDILYEIEESMIALQEKKERICLRYNEVDTFKGKVALLRLYFKTKCALDQAKCDYIMIKECMKDGV